MNTINESESHSIFVYDFQEETTNWWCRNKTRFTSLIHAECSMSDQWHLPYQLPCRDRKY
jgi:hypothetical protein